MALLGTQSNIHRGKGNTEPPGAQNDKEPSTHVQGVRSGGHVVENTRASLWRLLCHDKSDNFTIHNNIPQKI